MRVVCFLLLELTNAIFSIYTDETAHKDLYRALGMTLRTLDGGLEKNKGSYLREVSSVTNFFGNPVIYSHT